NRLKEGVQKLNGR
ncbi:MEG-2 (ESP15) family, partial [Schistosoma mansoni]